jgi:uncharacterized membrane protein HdeD (DUF308 family)
MDGSSLLLFRGILGLVVGALAFSWPGITLAVVVGIFAVYALIDGVTNLILGLTKTATHGRSWANALQGVVGIAAAVLTFLWPGVTALALVWFIAAWAIVTGVFEVAAAIKLRKAIRGEWLLALSGVLSVAFGLLVFAFPGAGAVGIAWMLGAYAAAGGILLIGLAVRLRTMVPVAVVLALGMALTGSPALAQTQGTAERFTALAVNMGDFGRSGADTVEIVVNRWSTDAERAKLLDALIQKGPEKLLDTLQDLPRVGYFRTPNSIGYDLHYARKTPMPDGGERVVIATDRYINFWEARNRPRSIDYPFTVIEMRINKDGEGEGKMSVATKITVDKDTNQIVLENYGTQPVLLKSVRREPTTK